MATKARRIHVATDATRVLSEAEAAHVILHDLHYGHLLCVVDANTEDWLRAWAIDALGRSIDEVKASLRAYPQATAAREHIGGAA